MAPVMLTFVVATILVVSAIAVITVRPQVAPATTSGTTTGTTTQAPAGEKTVTVGSADGLELQVTLNATQITSGESVQVSLSEFNTLPTVNNVSASQAWPTQVALGACRNIYDQPFGMAVYFGVVDAQNLSQGRQADVFPATACPMYIRLVTGYEFQPASDSAVVLPSSGAVPSPLTGNVEVGMVYNGLASQPLPAGSYTVVAADEWGALTFVYFQVG